MASKCINHYTNPASLLIKLVHSKSSLTAWADKSNLDSAFVTTTDAGVTYYLWTFIIWSAG